MEIPIKFPHPADVIAEEMQRFRHMTIAQRLEHLGSMVAFGQSLARGGSREVGRQNDKDRLEDEWQRAHREVFERYGR